MTLVRTVDTGNALDDKAFVNHRAYTVAFAVHRDSLGSGWHYVSLPMKLGLSHGAGFQAVRFRGEAPQGDQAWTYVTLSYLAHYGVEMEFNNEIRAQWLRSLAGDGAPPLLLFLGAVGGARAQPHAAREPDARLPDGCMADPLARRRARVAGRLALGHALACAARCGP